VSIFYFADPAQIRSFRAPAHLPIQIMTGGFHHREGSRQVARQKQSGNSIFHVPFLIFPGSLFGELPASNGQ
jgi:hypothetical protein